MKAYETLELEVVKFEAQDVITSSAVEPPVVEDADRPNLPEDMIPDGMTAEELAEAMQNGGILVIPKDGTGPFVVMPGDPNYGNYLPAE